MAMFVIYIIIILRFCENWQCISCTGMHKWFHSTV